ncbi:MAG: hypothetical protein E6Q97_32180 [Desulfurellales bacterium]|nr:MAG: hypothetical protein E6Q97_32180 [Desulfurellales bacterium]
MASIIGRQVEFGIGKETVRGTALTAAGKWIRKVTATILPKAQIVIDDTQRAVFEDAEGTRLTRTWYEGELEGILHADVLGYLLMNLYGTVNSATATGAAKDHTFSMLQSPLHPSYTMFMKDGGVVQEKISLGMVKELSIMAKTDDYVRFKSSFMGAVGSSNSDTPAYGTDYDFISKDITMKMASTSGGLSGATAIPVKELNINWTQTLVPSFVFGAYTPSDINNTDHALEVEMTLDLSDTTYRALLQADTVNYLQITIQGTATIGVSSNPKLVLTLNKAQVMEWDREGGANELVQQKVKFKGLYNATDGKMSSAVLTNLTSAY